MTDSIARQLLHSPAEALDEFLAYAETLRLGPHITWGVPAIDETVIPFHPGDLITLIGRPGAGKTSVLVFLAKREAQRIREAKEGDRCVVYVTWEQSVPEMEAMLHADRDVRLDDIAWGRVDIDELVRRGQDRASLPVWVIGMGLKGASASRQAMTPDMVFDAVSLLSSGELHGRELRPTLMLFDYMQLIPGDRRYQKWEQVYESVNACKNLAVRVGCTVVGAAQAGREVDGFDDHMPRLGSGQMSSALEQASDKVFGLSRPITWCDENDKINGIEGRDGKIYEPNDQLLVIRLLKQRMGSPSASFYTNFDPATMTMKQALPMQSVPLDSWKEEPWQNGR